MINYIELCQRLKGKSVGASFKTQEEADKVMPMAYKFSNPNGRPYHDDWTAKGLPSWLQPWGKIRRMDTTYMLKLPLKAISTNMKPRWMPWQEGYPGGMSSWIELRDAQPGSEAFQRGIPREVLAYDPVGGDGEWGDFGVELDGKVIECYSTYTKNIFGRRLHTNRILKPDMTHGDFHLSGPDASLTWVKR